MKIAIITICVIAGILAYAMMGVATVYIIAAADDADLDHDLDDYFGFGVFWPAVLLTGVVILVGKLACAIVEPVVKIILRVPLAIIRRRKEADDGM